MTASLVSWQKYWTTCKYRSTSPLVWCGDGAWGALDDEGHWSGMVGMVKRNEVDFALGENS